jgi:hypothetical protein
MVQLSPDIILIGLLIFLFLGALLWYILSRIVMIIVLRFRFRKGRKGEVRARKFLKKHGFIILSEQYAITSVMYIDHKPYEYGIRVDFLVRRGDKTAIVEVKTGSRAIDPLVPETRRQLFEYFHLYHVDELYFFDAHSLTLQQISFE